MCFFGIDFHSVSESLKVEYEKGDPIHSFFPLDHGDFILVVTLTGEIKLIELKSTRSYIEDFSL